VTRTTNEDELECHEQSRLSTFAYRRAKRVVVGLVAGKVEPQEPEVLQEARFECKEDDATD
jgi:hypothetical protein